MFAARYIFGKDIGRSATPHRVFAFSGRAVWLNQRVGLGQRYGPDLRNRKRSKRRHCGRSFSHSSEHGNGHKADDC